MPWKDHLNRFKQELNHLVEPGKASQPPPVPPHPPAVPPHPPAVPPFRGEVYWKPQFYTNVPINLEWDAKLGNGPDGWGIKSCSFILQNHKMLFSRLDLEAAAECEVRCVAKVF